MCTITLQLVSTFSRTEINTHLDQIECHKSASRLPLEQKSQPNRQMRLLWRAAAVGGIAPTLHFQFPPPTAESPRGHFVRLREREGHDQHGLRRGPCGWRLPCHGNTTCTTATWTHFRACLNPDSEDTYCIKHENHKTACFKEQMHVQQLMASYVSEFVQE